MKALSIKTNAWRQQTFYLWKGEFDKLEDICTVTLSDDKGKSWDHLAVGKACGIYSIAKENSTGSLESVPASKKQEKSLSFRGWKLEGI